MEIDWSQYVRRYRSRCGLTQAQLAVALGVAQRTVSRWERREDKPSASVQLRLLDLAREPDSALLRGMKASVVHCPVARALTIVGEMRLLALSPLAIKKRPLMKNWIGRSLLPLATGVLQTMLEDTALQRAIARLEIASVVATTRSVFNTPDSAHIGVFQTTISYFQLDGTVYADAIGVPVAPTEILGYRALPFDEIQAA